MTDHTGPRIAVVVYTKDDPIHVDTRRVRAVLRQAGYNAEVADIDWADDAEWERLTGERRDYGRHDMMGLQNQLPDDQGDEYWVQWHRGRKAFVRDFYSDTDRDKEFI